MLAVRRVGRVRRVRKCEGRALGPPLVVYDLGSVTRVLFRPTRPTRLTSLTVNAVLLVAFTALGCGGTSAPAPKPAPPAEEWFTERAAAAGIDFTHFNGMSGQRYYPEIMAPGVAFFDYDNDGDLDVYLVQSQMLGKGKTLKDAIFSPKGPLEDRLYRNDLKGEGTLHFTDVTEASGLHVETYGMGVAAGDYDNDGFVDLYRTGLKGAVLLHNNGNGTFNDATAASGASDPDGWGVSAAFVDYDRDGFLDLFVGNYLLYSTEADIDCLALTGLHDYCPPNSYRAQPSRLYRNRGNGTFEDVTR